MDSESLLILLFLLMLTVLVIWRFRLRRYRFLHESGVSIILGIVAGVFIGLGEVRLVVADVDCECVQPVLSVTPPPTPRTAE